MEFITQKIKFNIIFIKLNHNITSCFAPSALPIPVQPTTHRYRFITVKRTLFYISRMLLLLLLLFYFPSSFDLERRTRSQYN